MENYLIGGDFVAYKSLEKRSEKPALRTYEC